MTLNKARGRMFKSVGWTWNPVAGCMHGCTYCYARRRYRGDFSQPVFRERFMEDVFPGDGTWIFVCSMGDLFCEGVKDDWIFDVIHKINADGGGNRFLLQTKNPKRVFTWLPFMSPDRYIIGTTLETNRLTRWSLAPSTRERAHQLYQIGQVGFSTFLSLEPVADFDFDEYASWIKAIAPVAVEVGLENYTSHLPRTPPEKLARLIEWMRGAGFTLVLKDGVEEYMGGG